MPIYTNFGNFDENQTGRKQTCALHQFKACELESSKYSLFHEINVSNAMFRKNHNNFLRMCDLNISRHFIFLNFTCENVENISLFHDPRVLITIAFIGPAF